MRYGSTNERTKAPQQIREREAQAILTALEAGVVPQIGVQHLLVGRQKEVEEIIRVLDRVAGGASDFRLWVGDFGSGKSFILRTIEQLALQKGFVCATVDLTPARRFQASDGKGVALYAEILRQIHTRAAAPGQAMSSILERWLREECEKMGFSVWDGDEDDAQLMQAERHIFDRIGALRSAGLAYELAQCIVCFFRGAVRGDGMLRLQTLRWLGGQIPTKTEARRTLGIGQIVTDDNWTTLLFNLCELFRCMGYRGFVVQFDEVVNLYKLPRTQTREQNYERILNLYNECKGGAVEGLFLNLGATRKTVFDERRGMCSYGALKGRFGVPSQALDEWTDAQATVQQLRPLTDEEIFTLLEKIQDVFCTVHRNTALFTEKHIAMYMEAQLNRPGASEFLTPRAVIKDFLQLLSLMNQHPDTPPEEWLARRFGQLGVWERDQEDHDDDFDIEIY